MKIASLDIETLDLDKNTAMVSDIGVVVYDTITKSEEFLGLRPNLLEQLLLGRTYSKATVDFHINVFGSFTDLLEHLMHSETYKTVSILESHTALGKILSPVEAIWINGLSFDPAILESLYKLVGKRLPWNYKKEIDVRTINNLVNPALRQVFQNKSAISFEKDDSKIVAHDAIADARWNLVVAQEFYDNLSIAAAKIKT